MPPPSHRRGGGATGDVGAGDRGGHFNSSGANNTTTNTSNKSSSSSSSANNKSKQLKQNNNRKRYHNINNKNNQATQVTDDDPSTLCTVCADRATDWAMGPCSHVTCGNCAHRLRTLYNRKTCVICSQPQPELAVIPLSHYVESLTFAKALTLPNITRDDVVSISFIDCADRMIHFQNLRGFMCSHKSCSSSSKNKNTSTAVVLGNSTFLRAHARTEHRSVYCEICFTGNKSFVSELLQYPLDNGRTSSGSLRSHLRKSHPQCKFCRQYYLDDEKLYAHLQEAHETCSICERRGRTHEYYRNFNELERHYGKEHYMCSNEGCRGVVFDSAIELQTHTHSNHSGTNIGGGGARGRGFRVDLHQLHEASNGRVGDDADVARERQRQAARRRAFLSSHVVFTGALNFNDDPPEPTAPPGPSEPIPPSTTNMHRNSNRNNTNSSSASASTTPAPLLPIERPPDDGKFHPSRLPRDAAESAIRNTALVRRMRTLLDPASYEQFKQSSAQFRSGTMEVDEYFDAAVDVFGIRCTVRDVMPELVALLPSPLLREPLLRACFRKTDTPMELDAAVSALVGASIADTSSNQQVSSGGGGNGGGSRNSGNGETPDQFPTLNGGPTPPPNRKANRLRRFGASGPEDFPRLSRANPTTTAPAAAAVSASSVGGASSSSAPPSLISRPGTVKAIESMTKGNSSGDGGKGGVRATGASKTAASMLRESGPAAVKVFSNRSTLGMVGVRSTSVNSGKFGANAFPSLSSNSSHAPAATPLRAAGGGFAGAARGMGQVPQRTMEPVRRTAVDISETAFPALAGSNGDGDGDGTFPALDSSSFSATNDDMDMVDDEIPTSDVSMRAGPVWGGSAQGGRKKRGPGQGRGRRPATPPRAALQVMDGRERQELLEADSEPIGGVDDDDGGGGGSGGGKLKVIDVVEIARERKRAVRESALPGFAKNAYSGASALRGRKRK